MKFLLKFFNVGTSKPVIEYGVWGKHPSFCDFIEISPHCFEIPVFLRYFKKGMISLSGQWKAWVILFKREGLEIASLKNSKDMLNRPCPIIVYTEIKIRQKDFSNRLHSAFDLFDDMDNIICDNYDSLKDFRARLQRQTMRLRRYIFDVHDTEIRKNILKLRQVLLKEKGICLKNKSIDTKFPIGSFKKDIILFLRAVEMYLQVAPRGILLFFYPEHIEARIIFRQLMVQDFLWGLKQ